MRQWTDPAGPVLGVQSYGPFGEPRGPVGTPPWGFTGEWQDPAGMVYLRARWYNPYLNRFVQPDTVALGLGDPQSINRFIYARNNPTRYTDPTGHYIFEEGPEDPWHVFDPRVHSQYWYTQPGWEPEEPGDAEIIVAMTSPLWVPAAVVGAGALVADVAIPAAETAVSQAVEWLIPLAWQLYDRITAGTPPENCTKLWPTPWDGRQVINELEYSVHALMRMVPNGLGGRGVPPSVVENAVMYGEALLGKEPGTIEHVYENVKVVTDALSKLVITVIKTGH